VTVDYIPLNNRLRWRLELEKSLSTDIYFTDRFLALQEGIEGAKGECAVVRRDTEFLFLPYFIYPIPSSDRYDVQSAYGYAGSLIGSSRKVSDQFLALAWREIESCWHERGVVAAFMRCHPIVGNQLWFPNEWDVVYDRSTVAVNLEPENEIFAHPQQRKHRRDVAKAVRRGATVESSSASTHELSRFKELYFNTMDRLGAAESYYFSDLYFDRIAEELADECLVYRVLDDSADRWLAAALILRGDKTIHYHLGARVQDETNLNYFHLLFDTAAKHAAEEGYTQLHLGGGRSPAPNDSLLRFKRRVGTIELDYYTARRIVNETAYRQLLHATSNPSPAKFLAYR